MLIVPALHIHIIHYSNGQQIQISDGQPQLQALQEKISRENISRLEFSGSFLSIPFFQIPRVFVNIPVEPHPVVLGDSCGSLKRNLLPVNHDIPFHAHESSPPASSSVPPAGRTAVSRRNPVPSLPADILPYTIPYKLYPWHCPWYGLSHTMNLLFLTYALYFTPSG